MLTQVDTIGGPYTVVYVLHTLLKHKNQKNEKCKNTKKKQIHNRVKTEKEKGMMNAMRLLVLGSVAVVSQSAENCGCSASCTAFGDPHIVDFTQNKFLTRDENITLYSMDGFSVTAHTKGKGWMQEVHFGDEKISVTDCEGRASGTIVSALSKKFDKSNSQLDVKVWCAIPTKREHPEKYDVQYSLNINLRKTHLEDNECSEWASAEASVNASGLCTGNGKSLRRKPKTKAICDAVCSLSGDPHLASFFGKKQLIKGETTIDIYTEPGLSIIADTRESVYIMDLQVNGKTEFNVTRDCGTDAANDGKELLALRNLGVKGDVIIKATCKIPHHKKRAQVFHLDVSIVKTDYGSFEQVERDLGSTGVCMMTN